MGERKQVWWVDYNDDVKNGTLIGMKNDNVAVETADGFVVVRKSEVIDSYVAACGEAASRLMRRGSSCQDRAAKLLTQLAKIAQEPRPQES